MAFELFLLIGLLRVSQSASLSTFKDYLTFQSSEYYNLEFAFKCSETKNWCQISSLAEIDDNNFSIPFDPVVPVSDSYNNSAKVLDLTQKPELKFNVQTFNTNSAGTVVTFSHKLTGENPAIQSLEAKISPNLKYFATSGTGFIEFNNNSQGQIVVKSSEVPTSPDLVFEFKEKDLNLLVSLSNALFIDFNSFLLEIALDLDSKILYANIITSTEIITIVDDILEILDQNIVDEVSVYELEGISPFTIPLDKNFSIGWTFSDTAIIFTFNCQNIFSWCGITFSHGMMNTEIIVMLNTGGILNVTDYYSTAFHKPSQLTGTNFIIINQTVNSTGIYGQFSRALNPQSNLDTPLAPGVESDFGFAYLTTPNAGLSVHNNKGYGAMIFGATNDTAKFIPGGSSEPFFELDNNFTLGWQFVGNSINFTFNCYNIQGWCGISFVHGMINTELIVVLNLGTSVSITDYYSTQGTKPTQVINTPFTILSQIVNATGIFVTFSRDQIPESSLDQSVTPGLTTDFSYAYLTEGGKGFTFHNVKSTGLIVFGTTQANSKYIPGGSNTPYVQLDENFYLGWIFSGDLIVFTFNCYNIQGWCAISFVHGMENTEIIVMLNTANTITVTDYYSTAFVKPTKLTGTTFNIISQNVNSTGIFGTFSRLLSPKSASDTAISIGYITDFSFAYLTTGGTGFSGHNNQGVGLITFGATGPTAKYVPNGSNLPYLSLDNNFYIGWEFTSTNITFTFNCYNIQGWCGVSFVHGMENTEIIVMLNTANTITVTDYYSTAFVKPTKLTGTTFNIISQNVNSTGIFGTFSRLLSPKSASDTAISIGYITDFSFAYLTTGGIGFSGHNNQGVGLITFGATGSTAKYVPNGSNLPYLSLDNNFYIGWEFTSTNITFTFNCYNIQGWCGVSFTTGMKNTELIVALNSNGIVVLTDYYSTAFQKPTQKTGTELTVVSSLVNSTGIFTSFVRDLKPTSKLDTIISIGLSTRFSFAYLTPPDGFVIHDNIGKGYMTFGATNNTSSFTQGSSASVFVTLNTNFYLGWSFTTDSITFTFKCINIQGWCGIDFVKGMQNTEMIIARNQNGQVTVTDYYSTAYSTPSNTINSCITQVSSESSVSDSGITAIFTRSLNCQNSKTDILSPGFTSSLSWAYLSTNSGLDKHNNQGEGDIVFGSTNATSSFIVSSSSDEDFYRDHGIYMTVMWVGVIELAIISIRYFKWWPFSAVIHASLGCVAMVITLISAWKALKKGKDSFTSLREEKDMNYHLRLALTICALTVTQATLGIFFRYVQIFKTNIRMNTLARVVHAIIGWSLPITAMVNIKYGWKLKGQSWKMDDYIYPSYWALIILIALFEINYRWGFRIWPYLSEKKNHFSHKYMHNKNNESLLLDNEKSVRHIDVHKEIIREKKNWVFYDDYLLDVTWFKFNHPGGMFMFPMVYGQDIGKYINGCSTPDSTRPHYHTQRARSMIEKLKIKKMAYSHEIFEQILPGETHDKMQWTLVNRSNLATSTHCLEFTSHCWQMVPDPSGFEWMGKHFLITCTIHGQIIRRYYSLVVVNLAMWADEVRSHGFPTKSYEMVKDHYRLRLHMKHYRGGLMSTHLSEIPLGTAITIKGPLGPGLLIEDIYEKDYLIFGAGTGILPFLDIVYAVWTGKITKARLHIYTSFRDLQSSFGVELIDATSKRFPNNIKLYSRDGEVGFQLHSEFWRNMLPLAIAESAWICGPPAFNHKIIKILRDEGFSSDKIVVI